MDLVIDSIECTKCKKILSTPVILPCAHCMCEKHVTEEATKTTIECNLCAEYHEIPAKGFIRNRALDSLLAKKIDKIDLGDEYNSARDECSRFSDLFEQFDRMRNDPEARIHEVASELRNKVDLRREELKLEIDKEAMLMIENIDKFEKECKSSIKSDYNLARSFEVWRSYLKEWEESLSTFERNVDSWAKVLNESRAAIKELQSDFIRFNGDLLLNQLEELKPSFIFVSTNFYETIR